MSDARGDFVFPAGYINRSKLAYDISSVIGAAQEREAQGFVVGIPFLADGTEGPQARLVRGFIRALKKQSGLPIYEVDESFTSVEAEALMRDVGLEPTRERGRVDEQAAVLILKRFLASRG